MAKTQQPVEDDGDVVPLSVDIMDFSNLGRTVDGTGFVYRTLACVDKHVGPIKGIEAYIHLQHVDLSHNSIKDMAPLKPLAHALKLNLASNLLPSFKGVEPDEDGGEVWPNLTHLNLNSNAFTALPPLPFKSLRIVSFADNEIATCQDFAGHETIQRLDLSGNKLTTLAGLANLPALTVLNLSKNALEDLNGLGGVPALEELNVAENQLQALEGPWQELKESPVTSLDLSGNLLESAQPLEVLRHLPKLRRLGVRGNPFVEAAGTAATAQVLACHWFLASIDGEEVTEGQLEEARELNVARLLEERERKKEAEAAEAADAEG